MTYLATSINDSAVISEKAGAAIADVRGKAVKYDESGNVVLCAAGEAAIGIGIMTNDETHEIGADVDVQVKEIGLVCAGAAIAKGDELTPDADGFLVKAAGGDYVIAIAMGAAAAKGEYIEAQLVKYVSAAAADSGDTGTTEPTT